jgi:hypothetical protein
MEMGWGNCFQDQGFGIAERPERQPDTTTIVSDAEPGGCSRHGFRGSWEFRIPVGVSNSNWISTISTAIVIENP